MKFNRIQAFTLVLYVILGTGCMHTRTGPGDIQSRGFLSPDTFQVILTAAPDRKLPGLVKQRENARAAARASVSSGVILELGNYCIDYNLRINNIIIDRYSQIINIEQVRAALNKNIAPYVRHGKIVTEYYLPDNSCVIVFRVRKRGLRKEIESIRPVLQVNTGK